MTLQEAIELVTEFITPPTIIARPDLLEAERLLIEAGKREVANREDPDGPLCGILPGETLE